MQVSSPSPEPWGGILVCVSGARLGVDLKEVDGDAFVGHLAGHPEEVARWLG